MKFLISCFFLLLLFTSTNKILAQSGAPVVNPENMVGIIMYDSDEVIKKIKIKKEPKRTNILKSISVYNNKINEIKIFNYLTFSNVKTFISKKINEAKLTGDYRSMPDAQLKVQEMLDPIRSKIKIQDSILNTNFEKELTAKEYKNWIKYKKGQIKKMKPKAPQRAQRTQSQYRPQNQRNGYGRGTNRRRY